MNCERYLDLLSARLDGALTQEEERELMQHLQDCDACRAIARELEDIHSALADATRVQPPKELAQGVMERIRAQRTARRTSVRRLGTLAAALVLCVGLYPLLRAMSPVGNTGMVMEAADAEAPMQSARYAEQETAADGALLDTAAEKGKASGQTQNSQAASRNTQEYKYACATQAKKKLRLSDTDGFGKTEAWVLDSVQAMEAFLAPLDGEALSEVTREYDAEFFRTGRLLAVVVREPSSSITHEVTGLDEVRVWVKRRVPQAGDSDIACWLILAEGDECFGSTRALDVEWIQE